MSSQRHQPIRRLGRDCQMWMLYNNNHNNKVNISTSSWEKNLLQSHFSQSQQQLGQQDHRWRQRQRFELLQQQQHNMHFHGRIINLRNYHFTNNLGKRYACLHTARDARSGNLLEQLNILKKHIKREETRQ